MFEILSKQIIADRIKRIDVKAPQIAKKAKPGQFVLAMVDDKTMRISLPIAEANPSKETITLVFCGDSPSLERLGNLWIGDALYAVIGPLGMPEQITKNRTVACVGYGIGIAPILFFCRALRKANNKVIGIAGGETKKDIILESQMRLACQKIFLMTKDGTAGRKGHVAQVLEEVIRDEKVSLVYVAAPVEVVEEVLIVARAKGVKTKVIVEPLTIDGMGICGTGQIRVDGIDACVATDGPVFEAEKLDLEDLKQKINNFTR